MGRKAHRRAQYTWHRFPEDNAQDPKVSQYWGNIDEQTGSVDIPRVAAGICRLIVYAEGISRTNVSRCDARLNPFRVRTCVTLLLPYVTKLFRGEIHFIKSGACF